jgi:thioredoxin-related protein
MRDFKLWIIPLAILISIIFVLSTTSKTMEWMDFNKAVEKAEEDKKAIMVLVTSENCPQCESVLEILREEETAKIIREKFLPVKINIDSERDYSMLQNFLLTPRELKAPSLIFLTPKGELIEMIRISAEGEKIKEILQRVTIEECPCF